MAKPAPGTPVDTGHALGAKCVAYWPLSEGSGTTAYDARGGRTATFGTGFTWSTEGGDACGQFSGVATQMFSGTGFPSLSGSAWTLIVRYRIAADTDPNYFWQLGSAGGTRQLVHLGDSYSQTSDFRLYGDDWQASWADKQLNVVHEIAFVMDAAGAAVLYRDGVSQGTHAFGGAIAPNTDFYLGGAPGPGNYFNGKLIHLAVFNQALTSTEVTTFYASPYAMLTAGGGGGTQTAAPASDTSVGTWTTDTGATTNLYQAIDEASPGSDTDYIQSVAGPANAVYEAALGAVADPLGNVSHTLPVRAWLDTAGPPATITAELRQGANALSTPASFTDTITTTPTTYDDTLSGAMADAITNYAGLRLRLTANQPAGTPTTPTFVVATAGAAGTTSQLNVGWPSGYAVGDIGLLFIERAAGDPVPTFAAASGFVAVTGAAVATAGTGAVGTRLHTFWCRATSTGMGAVGINGSTDHQYAAMLVFRSCIATGDPWDVLATNFKISAGTPNTHPRVTTTVPNALIVCASGRDNDTNNGIFSAQLNAGLTGVAERFDNGSNTGGGGGIGVWTGLKVTAGDTGETTSTMASGLTANLTIALKGDPGVAATSRVRVSWAALTVPAPPVYKDITGGAGGGSSVGATLTKRIFKQLTGATAGAAAPSALLTTRKRLTGGAIGGATVAVTLSSIPRPVRELTGSATGRGLIGTAFLWGGGGLYGAAYGSVWGATGATVITGGPLPPGPKNLIGYAAGGAFADGVIEIGVSYRFLVASASGASATTATPTRRRPLVVASAGRTTSAGAVTGRRRLVAASAGATTALGYVDIAGSIYRPIFGSAIGRTTVAGATSRRRALVVATAGAATVTGAPSRRRPLASTAVLGVATTTAVVQRKKALLAPTAVGRATVAGAVTKLPQLPLTSVIWVVDHFEMSRTGTHVLWGDLTFLTTGGHPQVIWEEDEFKVYTP